MKLDLDTDVAEERRVFVHEPRGSHAAVLGVKFDADAIPAIFIAANIVVPVPQKGSRTVSPTNEKSLINRSASGTGNGAG